jgi:hypothetical protein
MGLFVDYGDVEDISYRLVYPALAFSIVTPLFIIARFWSRKALTKSVGADDWVILASFVRYYLGARPCPAFVRSGLTSLSVRYSQRLSAFR